MTVRVLGRPGGRVEGESDMAKGKHVIPNISGGWSVKTTGASRASNSFATQAEAIKFGRSAAKSTSSELYVHGKDGTIKNKTTYGREPIPARGRK